MSRSVRVLAALALAAVVLSGLTPAGRLVPAAEPAAAVALSTDGYLRFPGLGASGRETMSGAVYSWGCRGGEIGRAIYRWGCAGENNRYLMGHAYAAFDRLHDYVAARGRIAGAEALVGKKLTFRTTDGEVQTYRVAWAKVYSVEYWGSTGHRWAWNATARPSITFQTCYGSRSQYRLIVRAVLLG